MKAIDSRRKAALRVVFLVKDNGGSCRPSILSDAKPPFVAVIPTGSNSTRLAVLLNAERDCAKAFGQPSQPGAEKSGALRRSISPKQTAKAPQGGQSLLSAQSERFNMRCGRTGFLIPGVFQTRAVRRAANGNCSLMNKIQAESAGARTSVKRLFHRRLQCVRSTQHSVVGPRREQVCNLRMFGHLQRTITFNVGEVRHQHRLPHAAFAS
mgnify:CR=1 FL=1